jgi:hypothetical protein
MAKAVAKKKVKPQAKAKVKQNELAEEAELAEKHVEKTVVVKRESGPTKRSGVSSRDLVQVMADSIERTTDLDRVNAEDKAILVARLLLYGTTGDNSKFEIPRIREVEMKAKYCKEHR